MKLRFEPVTAANRALALALAVHPAQAGFVESVEECLAQADAERGWRPVLIYVEDAGAQKRSAGGILDGVGRVDTAAGGGKSAVDCVENAAGSAQNVADSAEHTASMAQNVTGSAQKGTDGTAFAVGPSAPVGFAMYKYFGLFAPLGRAWLDRLLIDARYQGHGYGAAAVTALCARIRAEYGCRRVYLSVYEDNAPAIRLYEKAGFAFNGQRDVKGEKVMVAQHTFIVN